MAFLSQVKKRVCVLCEIKSIFLLGFLASFPVSFISFSCMKVLFIQDQQSILSIV